MRVSFSVRWLEHAFRARPGMFAGGERRPEDVVMRLLRELAAAHASD